MIELIQDCWKQQPQDRPEMDKCVTRLGNIIANHGIFAPKIEINLQPQQLKPLQTPQSFFQPEKKLPEAYHWLNTIKGHSHVSPVLPSCPMATS